MRGTSVRMGFAEAKLSPEAALDELARILDSAAASVMLSRHLAVRYTQCRSALLDSNFQPRLPGFVFQCVSLQKFHEFINLFSPQVQDRLMFLERSFSSCRAAASGRRTFDVFGNG